MKVVCVLELARRDRRLRTSAVLVALVLLVGALATAVVWTTGSERGRRAPSSGSGSVTPDTAAPLVAWTTRRSMPDGFADAVSRLPGVAAVVPVLSGTVWMTGSRSSAGAVIDESPAGKAIPLEVSVADPHRYAEFAPGERVLLAGLGPDEVLLGSTSAQLRRIDTGGTLVVAGHRLRVAGVVPDATIRFAEVFTSPATAARLGLDETRSLLVQPRPEADREWLADQMRRLLPDGATVRIRSSGPRYPRPGAVLPVVLQKRSFGEFAADPQALPGGWLKLDPSWMSSHLQTADVPILGRVTCNTAMLPALRGALEEVVRSGLAGLVDADDYGGCFAARLIPGHPLGKISRHAWGSAIDLNVSANPEGGPSRQDPRLVEIFQRWGFSWGGEWLVPDPMHFEYTRIAIP
jgi:hypothetical protein